ncbi:MAG: universal stress protein [Candidatus Rokuibacteriota bacterium]
MNVDKILVPLDGSPLAEAALPRAVNLVMDNSGATIVLLRAAEARTLPGVNLIDAHVSVIREAEEYLEAVAARLHAPFRGGRCTAPRQRGRRPLRPGARSSRR